MTYREESTIQSIGGVEETSLVILNGTIPEITIPCNYTTETDGVTTTTPIHLTTEGYSAPVVAIADAPTGLTGEAWIDAVDDSIVHLVISAQCPDAVDENIAREISVLISRTDTDPGNIDTRTDVILHGTLTIQAGPYEQVAPVTPVDPDAELIALNAAMLGYGVLTDFAGSITGDTLTITAGSAVAAGRFYDVGTTPVTVDLTGLSGTRRLILRWTAASETFALLTIPSSQAPVKNATIFEIPLATTTLSTSWSQPVFAYEVAGTLADPVGSYKAFASTAVPKSHLYCDGSEVSRVTYPRLFAFLGTTFGAGDGSTTFNLPDRRGKVGVNLDSRDADFNSPTDTGGAKTVTLDTTMIPAHTHGSKALTGSATNFATQSTGTGLSGTGIVTASATGTTRPADAATETLSDTIAIDATHEHTSVGGGNAHTNLQPYAVEVVCIRA